MTASRAATADDAEVRPGVNRRGVGVVVGIVFLDLVGFGIIIPILPFYVRSFGLSDVFIGLLAASYSLAQFVAAPVAEPWAVDVATTVTDGAAVRDVVRDELDGIDLLAEDLIAGRVETF